MGTEHAQKAPGQGFPQHESRRESDPYCFEVFPHRKRARRPRGLLPRKTLPRDGIAEGFPTSPWWRPTPRWSFCGPFRPWPCAQTVRPRPIAGSDSDSRLKLWGGGEAGRGLAWRFVKLVFWRLFSLEWA